MSLAYLCDGNDCDAKCIQDQSLIHVVPNGWVAMAVTQGTGQMNNPTSVKHLCPKCSGNYQFKKEPTGSKQIGR